ncbi:TonB-dependent receptor [Shewanella gelidii]|uniref:TonB-dependent receptor n=2 Tax=Shewanella gelidii TaxID=1642821 RepID=A0A917NBN7_9GAMM|nr:TonB-dependent receptor [Shewanella gelidii]
MAICATFNAQANANAQDPLLNISEVIVVHGEQPSAIEQATTHWRISADDIRRSGAISLDQVLKNVPGLYVRVGGEGTPRVDIRGLKTRHIIYLVNGVPANNTNDGQFDPSVIPTSQIEVVEVSVGPSSVLYGPGGAGGVINIITKSALNEPVVSGKVEGGDNSTLNADLSVATTQENWQGLLSFSHQQSDGFPLSDDYEAAEFQARGDRDNADRETQSLYGQGTYWLSEQSTLTGNLSLKQGDWGKPSRDGSTDAKSKFERVDDYQEKTLQLGGAHRFSPEFTLRGFGYYNQNDVLEYGYEDATYQDINASQDGRSTVQGANIQAIMQPSAESVFTSALIAENQTWEAIEKKAATKKKPAQEQTSDDDLWLYTLATEYQFQSTENYGATLGAAYHYVDKKQGHEQDYSAQASTYLWLNDASKLAFGFAHKVRYPSMRNLYSQSSGNTELTPENSNHLEVSVNQQLGLQTELLVAAHHSQTDGYIAKDGDGIYQNLGDYRFQGIDLMLSSQYWDGLDLNLSYSYLDTLDKDADGSLDRLEHRPRQQVRLQASYAFATATTVSLNAERIMDQIYYRQTQSAGVTAVEQIALDDYTLVDVNVRQAIVNDNLSLYVRATNLLDENYVQSEALPQAGRQVFVGIDWQL